MLAWEVGAGQSLGDLELPGLGVLIRKMRSSAGRSLWPPVATTRDHLPQTLPFGAQSL